MPLSAPAPRIAVLFGTLACGAVGGGCFTTFPGVKSGFDAGGADDGGAHTTDTGHTGGGAADAEPPPRPDATRVGDGSPPLPVDMLIPQADHGLKPESDLAPAADMAAPADVGPPPKPDMLFSHVPDLGPDPGADATRPPTDALPDGPVQAPIALLQVDQGGGPFPVGAADGHCAGVPLTLTWQGLRADTCQLSSAPAGFASDALFGIAADAGAWSGDVTFTLTCQNAAGQDSMSAAVTLAPVLAPSITVDNADVLREVQRQCAARHGQHGLSGDGEVALDDTAALQLCRCLGYAGVAERAGEDRCYYSPGDNTLAYWNAGTGDWEERNARDSGNRCVSHLICVAPVSHCGELY